MPAWWPRTHILKGTNDFELAKRMKQLHSWLAEPEHEMSCGSFRVHLEIVHKLRSQFGTPVVVVKGTMQQSSGQVIGL